MTNLSMVLLTAALFLAALISLTAQSPIRNRLLGLSAAVAACIGITLYGLGFAETLGFCPIAVLRALMASCRMFAGVNEFSAIQSAPFFALPGVLTLFWAGHFLAFYATASAAIAVLGGRLLRAVRSARLRHGDLLILYGIHAESIAYARSCIQKKRQAVLMIDEACDASQEAAILELGGITDRSASALSPDAAFLRRIELHAGTRKLYAAALHADGSRNLVWAQKLRDALIQSGVRPEQTRLILRDVGEQQSGKLLAGKDGGFGDVYAFDTYSLAARLMIRRIPPCQTICFGQSGRAETDFSAAIVGFGYMGRAALRQLVMNGQFEGSTFRADIFDPNPQKGSLTGGMLLQNHDIRFHSETGKDEGFYHFLNERRGKLRYIVLSTGNAKENREIAQEISAFFRTDDAAPVLVQLAPDSVCFENIRTQERVRERIYTSDVLDAEKLDHLAMLVNQQYCRHNGKTPEENWRNCDYFSRMSCRAFADFAPALLKASGQTKESLCAGTWKPDAELLETLAQTEHMRWCAFHEVMGYIPMSDAVWQARAQAYAKELAARGHSDIRISKDASHRQHACLIPWDALDELSARENAVTGGHVAYKAMDRDNVLALPALLRES